MRGRGWACVAWGMRGGGRACMGGCVVRGGMHGGVGGIRGRGACMGGVW